MEGAFVSPKNHKTKEKKTMKTKRLLAAVLVIALAFCACTIVLASKPQAPTATVTIISEGRFVVKNLEVVVSGEDFNLDDALKAAHDAAYEGGAGKGYASATGEYGLYITKLWGDESGAFGYAVNNKMSGGLGDKVKAGDSIVAYIYTDKTNFSDRYTYFNVNHASAKAGEKLTLTLSSVGYDEKFGARPLRRAVERNLEDPLAEEILRNGRLAAGTIKVDAKNGALSFTFPKAGGKKEKGAKRGK